MSNYKLDSHLRNYIKQELYDYKKNKQMLENLDKGLLKKNHKPNISSRSILIITKKIKSIEKIYKSLPEEEKQAFEVIFNQGCNQLYAKTYYNITKDMYYNSMNKIIYLVAREYEQI